MTDKELIAAILAAGLLPPVPVPDRTENGYIDPQEGRRLVRAMSHAVGLYRGILEGLGTDALPSKDRVVALGGQPEPASPSRRSGSLKALAAFLAISLTIASPATAADCANADPFLEFAGVGGDFELTADPQDTAGNLILISNVADGASRIVAARVDGQTGEVLRGSLTTIADNFNGLKKINGPEFVQTPTGELGVVYAGPGGVHAVFRSATPARWNAFDHDAVGNVLSGSPPLMPSTSQGAYPAASMPFGQLTYGQYLGDCPRVCYGLLDQGVITDVVAVMAKQKYTVMGSAQNPTDGYIVISACDPFGSCGIYEAAIDGAGGFIPASLRKLIGTGRTAPERLIAERHPVTGSTIVFSNHGANAIDVWEQAADGGPLRLIRRVDAPQNEHFRVATDEQDVVLNYLIKSGTSAGSYTVRVPAPLMMSSLGQSAVLTVEPSTKISDHGAGAEFVWLPVPGKWAVFYRNSQNILNRCWVTP